MNAYRIDTTEKGGFIVVYNLDAGVFGRSSYGPFKNYNEAYDWAETNIDEEGFRI